jgi:uncharacterized protein (DUF58 family)
VGFAALNTGNNLLYLVLSLLLAFLVLSGVLSESALRGIEVRRRLPYEMFAGAPAVVGLEIANRQRRVPAFAVVVEDRLAGPDGMPQPAGRTFVLRVGPQQTQTRAYRIWPPRRGEMNFEGFQVFTRFPFGLFSKALTLRGPQATLVYPGVDRAVSPPRTGEARDGSADARHGAGSGALATDLRSYAPGDPMRRIHWRASLRVCELLVRQVESEERSEVEVTLPTAGQRPGERFERAVRGAASEVVALLDAGWRVALRTDEAGIEAGDGAAQRSRLLGFLARVEPAAPAKSS